MLSEEALELLEQSIASIPHDERGAFLQSDLIVKLANALPAWCPETDQDDPKVWLGVAKMIVKEAMKDDGTPADGMLPGCKLLTYCPDQLLSDGKGYLIRFADAPPEFVEQWADLAVAEARIAARVASAYNN
jgi:hypothetical protein